MNVNNIIGLVEDNEQIINQKIDDFLIWPSIRFIILQRIIDHTNHLDNAKSSNPKIKKIELLKNIVYAIFKNPLLCSKKTTVIFNTCSSNVLDINGRYYNRICNYFYDKSPSDSILIEEPVNFTHYFPKAHSYHYSKLFFTIVIEIWVKVISFISPTKKKEAEVIVNIICKEINDIHSFKEVDVLKIKYSLIKRLIAIRPTYLLYRFFFKNKKVKTVIIEDGYYGLDKSIIIKAASDLKLNILEPQHGFINKAHPAYNFGEKILSQEKFKSYFPSIFLSYGKFWSENIRIPNLTVELGNPHLEANIKNNIELTKSSNIILVIGSGVTVIETIDLLNKLLLNNNNYEIHYRPHPQEKQAALTRYAVCLQNGLKMDYNPLYKSLKRADIIIGELTTVIFEALLFNKQVYLFNSSYTKTYFDTNIKYFRIIDLENIDCIFEDYQIDNKAIEYYWSSNWENEYRKLILA